MAKGRKDELGAYAGGTGHADDPEKRGILESADARKVSGAVTAPVAQEGCDLGLPFTHFKGS